MTAHSRRAEALLYVKKCFPGNFHRPNAQMSKKSIKNDVCCCNPYDYFALFAFYIFTAGPMPMPMPNKYQNRESHVGSVRIAVVHPVPFDSWLHFLSKWLHLQDTARHTRRIFCCGKGLHKRIISNYLVAFNSDCIPYSLDLQVFVFEF